MLDNAVRAILVAWAYSMCMLPGCGPPVSPEPDDSPRRPRTTRPLIVAHRGLTSRAPENTVAAVQAAIDLGADGVEVDVQVTADGDAVIFHDDRLGRLTGRTEAVCELPVAELVRIPCLDPVTGKPTEETIPSLSSFLDRFGGKCLLFLELKAPSGTRAGILRQQLVDRVGPAIVGRGLVESTLVSSLDGGLIDALERAHPKVRTVYEFFAPCPPLEAFPETLPSGFPRTDWLGPNHRWVTADRVRWARGRYAGISTFTANLLEEIVSLSGQGVDLIQTDAPELALLWRSGKLPELGRKSRRVLTAGWPEPEESVQGGLRSDGSLDVTLPAGSVVTVTIPASARAINFVRLEIESRAADPGDANLMFVVLEEDAAAAARVERASAPGVLDRGARALAPHVQTLALENGHARLSATFIARSRTRSLFVAVGIEGGPHRLRLAGLEGGVLEVD